MTVRLSRRVLLSRELFYILIGLLKVLLKLFSLLLYRTLLFQDRQVLFAEFLQVVLADAVRVNLSFRRQTFGVVLEVIVFELLVDHITHILLLVYVVVLVLALRINSY